MGRAAARLSLSLSYARVFMLSLAVLGGGLTSCERKPRQRPARVDPPPPRKVTPPRPPPPKRHAAHDHEHGAHPHAKHSHHHHPHPHPHLDAPDGHHHPY